VARTPDPSDGRAQLITFTEKGRAAESILIGEFEAIELEMRARYGGERVDAMRAILEEIATPWEAGPGRRAPRRPAAGSTGR
jgi:DNA-binding MarR family transcriptional regulator